MTSEQIIFVSSRGWFQLAQGKVTEIQPWPTLRAPAFVVADFADAQVGVQYCKGKAAYAAAQIEKVVRAEGLIDGAVQVFIHKQMGHADSNQTLYTAVPLPQWQEFQSWMARQRDHCLFIPLAGLLATKRPDGVAWVLRSGSQLHVFGEHEGRMHYAAAVAMGTDPSDFVMPVKVALTQFKTGGWKGRVDAFAWATVHPGDPVQEQTLLDGLAEAGVAHARLLPHASFNDTAQASEVASALPGLVAALPTRAWAVPVLHRLAWFSEKHVLPVAAMVAVVAAGLGVFAFFADRTVNAERSTVAALQAEVEDLRRRVGAAQEERQAEAEAPELAFARQMGFAMVHDPVRMLATVRQAAGSQIRIQRVQLTKGMAPEPARFRVDGVVEDGSSQALSHFLAALRTAGWQAESTAPGDSAPGAFAYHFRAAPAGGR